ncbi:(Fe-S)-binding protein [Picrophilus oshimae]|uniref:Hypothetical oxidoreductase DUF224 n=1 Tax=Picrophilus torridus (strain ATCC 700027 / DSM 9790 / JCM 10055 / NBRC 100828 / KAW 2/3) TaxID=1122961 RepID=Q6L216_PICTO|nr:(Fe-S)-binding protein [Picrophilus oshimae]AAT42986.1 hypothetical oxidoreductase DUF224 [Picrophilus oshimae DSM 9789]
MYGNYLKNIRDIIYKNLMESYLPFPLDKKLFSSWTNDIRHGGETVIYTSYMYQIAPLLKKFERYANSFSKIKIPRSLMSLAGLFKPDMDQMNRSFKILKNISEMLKKSDVEFGYLYDEEPYSGALLIELGMIDAFNDYSKRLNDFFKGHGVKRIITLDPHTHNAIKRANLDLDVKNYLELVKFTGTGSYVFHDSCLYSRHYNMYDKIRSLINDSGIELTEDYLITSKEMGFCCGGPLGIISEKDSEGVAELRYKQLSSLNENILVACPLCYENLSKFSKNVKDIAEVVS